MGRARAAALLVLLGAGLLAGCSSGDGGSGDTSTSGQTGARAAEPSRNEARCPARLPGCRTASGRIIYVEAVDPDGDGDAHFVLVSSESITAPGVSVIDVKRSLRPNPLPGRGDRISAAGPVYRGSYDQRQIEAVELVVQK